MSLTATIVSIVTIIIGFASMASNHGTMSSVVSSDAKAKSAAIAFVASTLVVIIGMASLLISQGVF